MDVNTTTTNISFLDKIKNAFSGLIFGLILFIGSFILLWWNEGNCLRMVQLNDYVKKNVVSIDVNTINPANNGKLVYVSGNAISTETLTDNLNIGMKNAIALFRNVEMYQWVEMKNNSTHKNMGGSSTTTTTYSYSKKWEKNLINSSSFNQSQDHQNPSEFKVPSTSIYAQNVKFGAFNLSQNQISSIKTTLPITNLPENSYFKNSGGYYYYGANEGDPQIGDLKISYSYVPSNTPISIIAEQNNNNLIPDITPRGQFSNVTMGIVSSDQIIQNLNNQNALVTMGLRLLGVVLMFFGLSLLVAPLTVLADIVPFLSYITNAISGVILFLIALALSLITISIAWIAHRPFIAIPIIIVSGYYIYRVIAKRKKPTPVEKKPVTKNYSTPSEVNVPNEPILVGKLLREESHLYVLCPNCGIKYGAEVKADSQIEVRNFEDENLNQQGQQITCIKCGQVFTVPQE